MCRRAPRACSLARSLARVACVAFGASETLRVFSLLFAGLALLYVPTVVLNAAGNGSDYALPQPGGYALNVAFKKVT